MSQWYKRSEHDSYFWQDGTKVPQSDDSTQSGSLWNKRTMLQSLIVIKYLKNCFLVGQETNSTLLKIFFQHKNWNIQFKVPQLLRYSLKHERKVKNTRQIKLTFEWKSKMAPFEDWCSDVLQLSRLTNRANSFINKKLQLQTKNKSTENYIYGKSNFDSNTSSSKSPLIHCQKAIGTFLAWLFTNW